MMACLFCGGDRSSSNHPFACDGRQGRIEASDELPPLIAGAVEATHATSAAAASSVEDERASQRALVRQTIADAGRIGRTDDELQNALHLDGSSERPRRWELWKLGQIDILRDEHGDAVKRLTRTNRRAVVWVTTHHAEAR